MIETLAQIQAPHFTAGIVLWNDQVVEAADIVKYMSKRKWSRARVRAYCSEKGWKVSVVYTMERPDGRSPETQKRPRTAEAERGDE